MQIKIYCFSICLFLVSAVTGIAQQTFLHCGTLIDGVSSEVRKEVTVIVEADRIVAVKEGYDVPKAPSDTVIDLTDHTVMPGLIDLHVHIEKQYPEYLVNKYKLNPAEIAYNAQHFARITLLSGFTTVRDVGGTGVNISLRDAIHSGKVTGPRMFTSGVTLASTGGHGDLSNGYRDALIDDPGPREGVLDGPEQAAEAVRWRYKNGADWIKITATGGVLSIAKSGLAPQFSREELEAIVTTANDYNMHVAAHAHGKEGMKRAIEAGVHTIEHGTLMDEEIMDLMIEHGTYYVPTLTAGRSVADSAKIPGYFPSIVIPKALSIGPQLEKTFAIARRKGVKIAFGTDAGVFAHGRNAEEFKIMAEMGMDPMAAIHSATRIAAEVLGMEEKIGTLEPGKTADVIAVAGNPLSDMENMFRVQFVMKEGKIYKKP